MSSRSFWKWIVACIPSEPGESAYRVDETHWGSCKIVFDFSWAHSFSTSTLDALVIAAQTLAENDDELRLVGSPEIRKMSATRVDRA